MSQAVSVSEVEHFSAQAHAWWDEAGPMRTLHHINPLRCTWVDGLAGLRGKRVLDIGCGGGLLSEAMARCGAEVTGIDLSDSLIDTARLHAATQHWGHAAQAPRYMCESSSECQKRLGAHFDVVCCMELLEHVDDVEALLQDCAGLLKPGGWGFFSTINRHPLAFVGLLLVAETLTRWVPPGTHRYDRFIRPSELRAAVQRQGLYPCALQGMAYDPLRGLAWLSDSTRMNYFMACRKPVDAPTYP